MANAVVGLIMCQTHRKPFIKCKSLHENYGGYNA